VDQVATLLRSIESSKCLAEGSMPVLPHDVLPHDVHAKCQSAFDAMISKLELLKARESKLKEWKSTTVEEMHRRLSNLLTLRFPLTITEKITKMKKEWSKALEEKADGLDRDVQKALKDGDSLTIDLVFQEVKNANDADSDLVNTIKYNFLIHGLGNYLDELVSSIKTHYMNLEIKEAHLKQELLWKLEKAAVAKTHVAQKSQYIGQKSQYIGQKRQYMGQQPYRLMLRALELRHSQVKRRRACSTGRGSAQVMSVL